MKKLFLILALFFSFTIIAVQLSAQCSVCTRTAEQLGEQPARGLNAGIIYLAAAPFLIAGYVYYRWKKSSEGE